MIKEAIDRILEIARPETVQDGGGRTYFTRRNIAAHEPSPETLETHSLQSLVDLLGAGDEHIANVIIHIVGPTKVGLISKIFGDFRQRLTFARAVVATEEYPFDGWLEWDQFMVAIQQRFVDTGDRSDLIRIVGNIKNDAIFTLKDDGVSQVATVRTGITTVGDEVIKNPVRLAPFRTFPEIDQPESEFVFRLQKGGGGMPLCALFPSDGGAWKITAMASIKEWMEERLPDTPIIS